ncbi:MAG: T9SS type A sorting domain-containing protein [Saprospiraceae bacterium]|nr:T9SS type A sorting domain-containing protein [Saprospiraceae bacterium]
MFTRIFASVLLLLFFISSTQAHVVLETRLTGKSFKPEETIDIKWSILVEHDQIDWGLYFSKDGGDNWEPIEEGLPLYQVTYEWTAPHIESSKMLVRIVQNNDMTEDYFDISDTFSIHSDEVTPIYNWADVSIDINLSPNPVQDIAQLNIHSPLQDFTVRVLTTDGQIVEKLQEQQIEEDDHIFYWDTTNMSSGLYLVEIERQSKVLAVPIVVNH